VPAPLEIHGETQGTTYTILIADQDIDIQKSDIDSIFHAFDLVLSTYIDESVISRINASETGLRFKDDAQFFEECYRTSLTVYEQSDGYFDPSVFPLVKGWGFMGGEQVPLDSNQVAEIMHYVSFEPGKFHELTFGTGANVHLEKFHPEFKLDFNAIAQGYSVDVIGDYLAKKGCKNYYVEVGGEIVVHGKNAEGKRWRIGVDSPIQNAETRELENIVHISDKGVATSGNYRNFYTYKGKQFGHTLNPKTGFPVQHSLLSATVIADNAAFADAYATLFMVLGVDGTLQFIEAHPEAHIEAYLLYADESGEIARRYTPGFKHYLENN
jgi:thiamine biosynthesis lipoprotein